MRAGTSSAVQQTLTPEAASVLKHSLSLARRRGHAQITPLHVAATLLSSRLSVLRRACLKSQPHQASHPLQCRALELCFNVALNRLPTTPGPLLHGQPSLSNALVAALKRAQAHQRRGCIEQQQQQPLLAVKVELEQLILSILDDPSVSRVMREAGFSSTAVKNNLEDCSVSTVFQCYNSSGGIYSTPSSPPETPKEFINQNGIRHTHLFSYSTEQNPFIISPQKKILCHPSTEIFSVKEDVKLVIEILQRNKRRNCVIVGDSVSVTEGLVAALMGKVEEGDVPEELKSAHIVKFHFSSAPLNFMKKEEVDLNISDLRRKVDATVASGGKGVIIYTGDLKWTIEDVREGDGTGLSWQENSGYSPVDHLVGEIGRLISCYSSSNAKVWLVATANYQTYMKSQMKQSPLDIQWALQALFVPSGGLGLSLMAASESFHDTNMASLSQSPFQVRDQKPFTSKGEEDITCCTECMSNYENEKEAGFSSIQQKSSSPFPNSCKANNIHLSSNELPYWLKQQGRNVAEKDDTTNLKRKWNRLCHSLHQGRHDQNHARSIIGNQCSFGKNNYYSSYPWWPSYGSMFLDNKSISFSHDSLKTNQSINSVPVPRFRRQQSCHIEFNFSNGNSGSTGEQNLDSLKGREDKNVKITLSLGNSPVSDAVKCTEKSVEEESVMCQLLRENVPWQSSSIPIIVEALMNSKELKKDTWFLIQGNDLIGKRRLALGITELLLGSTDSLICFNLRMKEDIPGMNCEMLKKALGDHGRLVVLLEYIDFSDPEFLEFLADGFRSGRMGTMCKNEGSSCHPIFVLTKSDSTSYGDDTGKLDSVIKMEILVSERTPGSGTYYSDHKHKADWDLTNLNKIPRKDEAENVCEIQVENGQKEFMREISSKNLDLNMKADEEECGDETKEFSPVSSDLTSNDQHNSLGFLDLIKNHFDFNRDSAQDRLIREMFLSNIRGSFEEIFGTKNLDCFSVEENVLEEISLGSGTFLQGLFQQWLKDIFQSSLKRINICKKEEIHVRLCTRNNAGSDLNNGFKGSCLPRDVPITYLD